MLPSVIELLICLNSVAEKNEASVLPHDGYQLGINRTDWARY